MIPRTPVLLTIVLPLLSVGCASTSGSSVQQEASRDLLEMKERILELQEKAAVAEVELARLRGEVRRLEGLLATGEGADPHDVAAQRPPEPESSDVPTSAFGAAAEVEESDLELETAGSAEGADMPVQAVTPGAGTSLVEDLGGSTDPATVPKAVEPAAQALYDRGYTFYHQGRYLDAEASFQRFLQAYPDTDLSDNALYWIGEARYARGDIRGALSAFQEMMQNYPDGNKIPDGLIKEGDCLASLGDQAGARSRYEEVRRRYPDSAASVMAEERLSGLD